MGFIKYNRYFGGLCTENEEDNVKTRIMENMYCCFVRVQEGTAKKKKKEKKKKRKKGQLETDDTRMSSIV